MRFLASIVCFLTGLAPVLYAADLRIANRPPKADEVGYRPAAGATNRLNPPSFIWLHETNARTYELQWSRQADFRDAREAVGFQWNTYTHNQPLSPGTWHWRYRYTTAKGQTSEWSVARSVTIPGDAVEFPMPSRAEQRERLPQGHPRLFMRPEDLPRLRALAKGERAGSFARIKADADRYIKAGPTPEPEHLGSARDKENKEMVKYWWPNREQAQRACLEAETIAFVYLMTGEDAYKQAARRWLLHLAAWNPDGPTNFRLNCEAGKPMLYRPARAYDWAWEALSVSDREQVQKAMRRRAQDAWESGEVARGVGHLNRPFNSHGNRTWHKLGECAIAFYGEIPEAEMWLDYAVNKFYSCYPIWADEDGGWHEGVSYWSGYMGKAVWWLQVAHTALGIDGLKKPFFAQVGDYPLYIAPPNSPNMGFGDLSYRPPSTGIGGMMEYFIRAKGAQPDGVSAAYWRWWTEQWRMKGEGGVLGFLYEANLPPLPQAKAPVELSPSKVFRGIGVASLHSSLLDSREDVHLLFKSSPFGTQSHGHNPHNTFQLNAYGEALLTTCVYRDLHGSKFHYQWAHSTVAHNGVLVNGEGQIKHTAEPHGRIVASKLTPRWDYVAGDATAAYGKRLERYLRHVIFIKPDMIVICDELAAVQPATFQFMLHALAPFTLAESRNALSVEQPMAGAGIQYLSPVPLSFRQWDGFEPKPDKPFPNQWHVEAGTREVRKQLDLLTVIVPHRSGQRPEWSAERLETAGAVGLRLTRGGKPLLVAFRKAGVAGSVSLGGTAFDDHVLVKF